MIGIYLHSLIPVNINVINHIIQNYSSFLIKLSKKYGLDL